MLKMPRRCCACCMRHAPRMQPREKAAPLHPLPSLHPHRPRREASEHGPVRGVRPLRHSRGHNARRRKAALQVSGRQLACRVHAARMGCCMRPHGACTRPHGVLHAAAWRVHATACCVHAAAWGAALARRPDCSCVNPQPPGRTPCGAPSTPILRSGSTCWACQLARSCVWRWVAGIPLMRCGCQLLLAMTPPGVPSGTQLRRERRCAICWTL